MDGVIGDVLAGALGKPSTDPTARDFRNEVVSVGLELASEASGTPTGNGVIEISNTFVTGERCCLQRIIVPNEGLTSVVLADVLDNDGIKEIVTGSSSGFLRVYRHSVIGDLSSLFNTTPTMSLDIGSGVIELATEYRGRVVPEPASLLLIFVGACGLCFVVRRSRLSP